MTLETLQKAREFHDELTRLEDHREAVASILEMKEKWVLIQGSNNDEWTGTKTETLEPAILTDIASRYLPLIDDQIIDLKRELEKL